MARAVTRTEKLGLWILGAFTAVALIGYGTFGVDPSRLSGLPSWLAGFYGSAFVVFAQGHVWIAGAVLCAYLFGQAGAAWIPAFLAVYAVSLVSELAGTTVGVPFGAYEYGELLGARWFGRVPWVIPASWFLMTLPSYAIARLAYPDRTARRILLGAGLLLTWDLALDPAMSFLTRYWVWHDAGPYYGMPLINLFGWFLTGAVLMGVLSGLRSDRWIASLSPSWLGAYYGLNLLLPLGMCAVAGLGGAVVLTGGTLALLLVWVRVRARGTTGRAAVLAGGVR